ncbi:MAG: peptidylprolyl isomerase [Raineya sp.]|nr:peptidylprolyl isomerase [Raineya sp.]
MQKTLVFTAILLTQMVFAQKKDSLVLIQTDYGDMLFVLYEQTPKHRANFLKLVREKFYDGLLFHRVIKDFMIQGGDPNSRNAKPGEMLGMGGLNYRIDAEFHPDLFHKRGALAAARDNNPQKASSSCQFYIVQGRTFTDEELDALSARLQIKFPVEHREFYKTKKGTPHLDQNYTVFGEMLEGFDVLEKIIAEPTDSRDRPLKDIRMKASIKVMKRKEVTKKYGFQYPQKTKPTKKKKKAVEGK